MDPTHCNTIWQDNGYHDSLQLHSSSLPNQPTTLDSDALPPTSLKAGYPGLLSLHDYRKYLSQDDDAISLEDSNGGKTLKRKNAAFNLNQSQPCLSPPFGSSSAGSSPPPLSPSYSLSVVSQRSEQELDRLDGYFFPYVNSSESHILRPKPRSRQNLHKLLDTFRDRLETFPELHDSSFHNQHQHNKACSDSMLLNLKRPGPDPKPTNTIIHHGTSFEILNPHESLDFARIVSYIEDVDAYSVSGNKRDSYLSADVDVASESVILEEDEWIDHRPDVTDQNAHYELIGEVLHNAMPSISERLEETDSFYSWDWSSPPVPLKQRPVTAQTAVSVSMSELGEPGPQVFFSYSDAFYDGTMTSPMDINNDHRDSIPQDGRFQFQRRSSRRSAESRKRGKAGSFKPFRRLCGVLRKEKLFWQRS